MAETVDIWHLLETWPYDPEHDVRLLPGLNGRDVLQVRLPLGVEQYELHGRPDGRRPFGAESLLDHHLARLKKAQAAGLDGAFVLEAAACAELFHEGTLYYQRYLRLFQMRDWVLTARDTARNLRLFDFVHRYAARQEDRVYLEPWRPYVLRIHATAAAMLELERGAPDLALRGVREAIAAIEALPELEPDTFKFERDRSLVALRDLAAQLERQRPESERDRLERELRAAIETQEFERAAVLRDRLRALGAG